jgi:hypothetical protein
MDMKPKGNNTSISDRIEDSKENDNPGEYPLYPSCEDIYCKCRKDDNVNPEDTSEIRDSGIKGRSGKNNRKDFNDDMSGSDLDVPGSELDDDQEIIGSEDEENNYYSLGGDDHNDLDEDEE